MANSMWVRGPSPMTSNVSSGSKLTVSATSDLCPKLEVNRTESARKPTSTRTPHGSLTATDPRCHALGRIGGAQGLLRRDPRPGDSPSAPEGEIALCGVLRSLGRPSRLRQGRGNSSGQRGCQRMRRWPPRYRHLWVSVCACHGRKDAATQVSQQRRRQNSNSNWLEYRQQFNSGAPALNSLIFSDVSAHATGIWKTLYRGLLYA